MKSDNQIDPNFVSGLVKELEDQRAFLGTQAATKAGEIAVLKEEVAKRDRVIRGLEEEMMLLRAPGSS